MKRPVVSIILPTYNAEVDLKRFFRSYREQSIDKTKVELLVVDGGSTDKTKSLAKKNGGIIIHNPYKLAEPGVALGCKKATGELIMILSADHAFEDKNAIQIILDVFKDSRVDAAFPKHGSGPGDNMYSRYVNVFTDPVTHFVYQDAANARTFHRIYKTRVHTDIYDMYDYHSNAIRPLIALAQGFTGRREIFQNRSETSDDVLAVYDMIGANKHIAYVHGVTIWHYTIADVHQFIVKTRRGVENALLRKDSGISKRKKIMTVGQHVRMYLFVPYAFTIVLPLLQSVIGAVRDKEPMWLAHWYVVLISACVITTHAIVLLFR